jgi:hypothetical protein
MHVPLVFAQTESDDLQIPEFLESKNVPVDVSAYTLTRNLTAYSALRFPAITIDGEDGPWPVLGGRC